MRVYQSSYEDIDLPTIDLLTFLFEDSKIHIEAANPVNHITKAEARDAVRKIAFALRDRYGIGTGGLGKDVVLSTSSGNPFIPVLVYSIIAAGGVYSGAPTSFTVGELVRQVQDADAKVLLCSPECAQTTIAAAKHCSIPLDNVLIIDAERPKDWQLCRASDRMGILDFRNGHPYDWRRLHEADEVRNTTACLLYSSGTTGLPKGVRISHRNLVGSTLCCMRVTKKYMAKCEAAGKPFHFKTIAHLPMAHIGGVTWSSLYPYSVGGEAYWVPKYEFETFIEYHRRYRLTTQWTVPPIWLAIANSPKVTDHFDSLQVAISGAAPMGPELTKRAAAKLGKGKVVTIGQLWGATETTGSMTGVDWTIADESCSMGLPVANMKVRLVDENNEDVKPGQPGEMLVSGPVVCQGYHNRPDANKNAFHGEYYRTGDVGLFANGYIHLVDRLKELIKYKGLQVAPAELEALLVSHPKIADAAVIGIQDESRATEVPRAFIVKRPGMPLEAQEAIDFVRKNLADHKRLRGGIVFIDEIPKSASGKILRKELRSRVAHQESSKPKL